MHSDDDPKWHRPKSMWYCAACRKKFWYKSRIVVTTKYGDASTCPECGSEDIVAYCKEEMEEREREEKECIKYEDDGED